MTAANPSLIDVAALDRLIDAAFAEDLGEYGDVTTNTLIPAEQIATATIAARKPGVIAGLALLPLSSNAHVTRLLASETHWPHRDGEACAAGGHLVSFTAPLRAILTAERVILNLLTHLSGIATLTRQFVDAVDGTGVDICDTRKTTPGMRQLEKYAVTCGGGVSHRMGLYDAMMVKDNHIAHISIADLPDALAAASRAARDQYDLSFVQVEVDTLEQFQRILQMESGTIDMVLLDNMSNEDLRRAVAMRNDAESTVILEASGGVNLDTVRGIAEAGIDRISIGALTHSAPILDLGMDIETVCTA